MRYVAGTPAGSTSSSHCALLLFPNLDDLDLMGPTESAHVWAIDDRWNAVQRVSAQSLRVSDILPHLHQCTLRLLLDMTPAATWLSPSLPRTLSALSLLCVMLVVPDFASAHDGEDMMRSMLGEMERRAQRRPDKDVLRRLEPVWTACAAGDIAACHSAAAFPLNAHGRALLQENLLRAEVARQVFEQKQAECAVGSIAACDAALAYPFATDRATLVAWRELASELARVEQERRNAQLRASEERMRAIAASHFSATAASTAAASDQSAVRYTSTPPTGLPREVIIGAFAILWLVWFLYFRKPGPLEPVSAISNLYTNLRRRLTPPRRKVSAMLDDREQLLSSAQRSAVGVSLAGAEPMPVMSPGQDKIRVKIKRDQVTGLTGKVTFSVNFIAELSPHAREAVRQYRFGKTVLYQKDIKHDRPMNVLRLLWRMLWLLLTRKRWQITIADLVDGRTIQCKDILEVLDVEESITVATKTFACVLRAASWFGGEEIVEF